MLADGPILDDIFKHANKPIVIHSEDETMVRRNMKSLKVHRCSRSYEYSNT